MSSALEFADVRTFASGGDVAGLLGWLRPAALIVDSDAGAEAAAVYAREHDLPLLHVSLRDSHAALVPRRRVGGGVESGEGPTPEAIRNIVAGSLFAAWGAGRMNATERAALLQGLEMHDEMTATVDERTLDILERRRRTTIVGAAVGLCGALLLAADLIGLVLAMLLAEWLVNRHKQPRCLRRSRRGRRLPRLVARLGRGREALRALRP